MENNEIMNEGIDTMMVEVVEGRPAGLNTGVAMAIGAGAVVAACVTFKLAKKLVAKFKAKKEQAKNEEDYVDVE